MYPEIIARVRGVMKRASADKGRERMVREIEDEVRFTSHRIGRKALSDRVMAAMAAVPRHEFVPVDLQDYAYENRALAIGSGQTISQPYIVALMTDLLALGPEDVVLEVGTGCGYQTAILARLAKRIFSVEIIRPLADRAAQQFERMGIANIETRVGDGREGWPEAAPFDSIIVTAAAEAVPPALLTQLKPGGRMVLPLGGRYAGQELILLEKDAEGEIAQRSVLPVVFVPLTAGAARD